MSAASFFQALSLPACRFGPAPINWFATLAAARRRIVAYLVPSTQHARLNSL